MNENPPADWKLAVSDILSKAKRIVVCGIGNDVRGDDAAGILCLRALKRISAGKTQTPDSQNPPVFFVEGGEAPENQTGRIRSFQPDIVVLIDAARSGKKHGEIFLIEKEMIADEEISTHRISLSILVRFIEESIGAGVVFLGIEPAITEIGTGLSDPVRQAVAGLTEYLSRYL